MKSKNTPLHKPVILLAIDTLMSYPLEVATQTGRAPAMQFLMEKGQYIPNLVSSFPTMSVTIDSSLLTGTYADQHRIPGLNWFDDSKETIINYGTGLRESVRLGTKQVVHNTLYRLNNEHLSGEVTTIYEELAKMEIPSASINSLIYRGNTLQELQVPWLLRPLTNFKHGEWSTNATSIFSLGVFSKLRKRGVPSKIAAGNYKYTAKELRYLIKRNKLPMFTLCMFQDLDVRIHFKGPMDIKGITKIDREIQKILNLYPSWEEALNQNIWMLMGDNGQGATGTKYSKYVIDLRKTMKNYRIKKLQREVHKTDELVLCVNQRMAYIYLLKNNIPLSRIIESLKKDSRIDIIAWKNGEYINIVSGLKRGLLRYRKGRGYKDVYEQHWNIEGETELLDLTISDTGIVSFGNYPDALARLYGALYSHEGNFIVVNAKPGCEFKAQSTPFHLSGAAHGSLHRQESLIPLVIAGTTITPKFPRIVNMKEYILKLIYQQETINITH